MTTEKGTELTPNWLEKFYNSKKLKSVVLKKKKKTANKKIYLCWNLMWLWHAPLNKSLLLES